MSTSRSPKPWVEYGCPKWWCRFFNLTDFSILNSAGEYCNACGRKFVRRERPAPYSICECGEKLFYPFCEKCGRPRKR